MSESVAFGQKLRYFKDQNLRGNHMKMNFEYFQIQKWILQTVRSEKVDNKMWSFFSLQCSLPELWSLNFLKKCIFCNFVLPSARNLSLLKHMNICIYASERPREALSENGIVYCAMTYYFGNISVWIRRILLNFSWVSIFLVF